MEIIALDALGNYYYYWDLVSNNESFSISKSHHLLIKVLYKKTTGSFLRKLFIKKYNGSISLNF